MEYKQDMISIDVSNAVSTVYEKAATLNSFSYVISSSCTVKTGSF